jgi:Asp-tRNA(Asn)/Glu-tRNA(Gln) amidotransferase A subunit family amidase
MNRIPSWFELDAATRRRWQAASRDRATAINARLNAFLQIEPPPHAVEPGPLGGLPCGVKDMLRTAGRQPSGGLADVGKLTVAGVSAIPDKLEKAGADIVGFTGMTELASEPSGFNAAHGRVKNPWNLDYISGGSSSGSAAAVASGAVAVATGSDTGGSLRIPAHCCGVTAWKPTYGLVAMDGAMPLAPTLDTIGLLARGADDLMSAAEVITHLPAAQSVQRAVLLRDAFQQCAPAIVHAGAELSGTLAKMGIAIADTEALATIDAIDAATLTIVFAESGRVHRRHIQDETVEPMLRRRLAKGLQISDEALSESIGKRASLIEDFESRVLSGFDIAIAPIMAITTPTADECDPASDRFSGKVLYALSRFTRFVNLLGYPAVALPAGFDEHHMPVGIQIIGRPGSDLALLELAQEVQSHSDWHGRVPTAVADLFDASELIR